MIFRKITILKQKDKIVEIISNNSLYQIRFRRGILRLNKIVH
jgi:hypothetical protein